MAQSFYIRLLTLVDDYGRYEASPVLLRNHAFPLREDIRTSQVLELCQDLAKAQLAIFYKADGKEYLQFTNWTNKPRAEASKFPAFDSTCEQMFTDASSCKHLLPKPLPLQKPLSEPSALPRAHAQGFQKPTLEEVKKHALSQSIPEEDADKFYHHYNSIGWTVKGQPIDSWRSRLVVWWHDNKRKETEAKEGGNIKSPFQAKIALEECQKEINRMKADPKNKKQTEMGTWVLKQEAIDAIKDLEAKSKELQEMIRKMK